MTRILSIVLLSSILTGCVASQVSVIPESINVQVGDTRPGDGYVLLGAITAKHGGGCGLYGSQGDFEGAMNILRNTASKRGADYVQILNQKDEHMSGLCLDRAYVINGFAFKKKSK